MSLIDMLGVDQNGNASPLDARNTAATDPMSAIERVASQKGINPDHLIGLAKLETRLGDATIKGDGQDTYNLFNIKDFSKDGTGIRARDKAEGSNDRYRKYGSYEESTQDLIDLLERRYPGALNASTPEEFANALKAGGYATDPAYVQKLTRTIGSRTNSANPKSTTETSGNVLDQLFSQDEAVSLISGGSDGLVESAYKPIKDRSFGDVLQDTGLATLKIGPTALKSVAEVGDMLTGGKIDLGVAQSMQRGMDAFDELGSDGFKRSKEGFAAVMQDDTKGIGDMFAYALDNPAVLVDNIIPTVGSMFLPAGAAKVAAGGARLMGAAQPVVQKAAVATSIGAGAAQNAAQTFAELKDQSLQDRYAGAATSFAVSALMGIATGGGADGTIARRMAGDLQQGKIGLDKVKSFFKSIGKEALQEAGEESGNILGKYVGSGELPTLQSASKQVAFSGALGGMMGGGVDIATGQSFGGGGLQPNPTPAPNGPLTRALGAGSFATQPAPTPVTTPPTAPAAPAAPTGAAPVAQPTAQSAPADPQLAAMSDADLNALIEAIDAADDDAVTDEQWSQYANAITEINRRAEAQDAQADAPTTPIGNADGTEDAQASTYMPGPEVNANRAKEQPKVVLQNRDRSGAASVLQMINIAANPDFLRIGPSTEMTTGAPVVFGDLPATAITGRPETVVDGKGDRIQAQYAVVDAGDLIPSNNADGTSVQAYENGLPGKLRAVAGNGRTAGIQKAYQQGTAAQYRQDLIDQAKNMGLDADAIRGMQQPVLVRVMDAADVRDDMGDRTNISGTQRLSPVEQAANDARRLNLADLSFDDNGNPTQESLRQFINAMEDSEKGDLMGGKSGTPTKQAIDRLMAATFKQAYDSDELVDLYAQAPEPEARAILNAAGEAAGALAALKEMNPDFDVREAVADAVKLAVNASRQGMPLAEFAQNADLDIHPDAFPVARFLSQYANKPRQMANGLREWANDVLGQAEIDRTNQSQGGLFGAKPTLTREELFARLGNIDPNDQFSIQAREALAKREAEKSAAQELPQPVAIDDIPDDLQPEDVVEAPSDFDLEAQTPEQLQAQADERAAEEKRQRNAEQAAEAKAQADAEVDSFTLTGSDRPADANPNQGDLLAADQPQQGDVLNNVGQPFTSPKAAEIKAKKDGKGGQVVPVQGGYVVRMPQNMSGTPSGTIGTRTDAKAGPGFTAADVVRNSPVASAEPAAQSAPTLGATEEVAGATQPTLAAQQQEATAAGLPEGARLEIGDRGLAQGMVRYMDSDGNPLSDWAEDDADAAAMAIEQAQNAPKEKLLRDHFVAASNADAAMRGNDAAEMLRLAGQRDALVKALVDAGYTQAEIGANSLGISVDEFNRLVKDGVYSRERGAPDDLFPKSGTRKKKPSAKQAQESKPNQPPARTQQAQAATESAANEPENQPQSAPEWWAGRSEDERRLLISVTNRLSGNAFANATTEWDSLSSEQKAFLAKEYDKYASGGASVELKAIAKLIARNDGKSSAPKPKQPPASTQQEPKIKKSDAKALFSGKAMDRTRKAVPADARAMEQFIADGKEAEFQRLLSIRQTGRDNLTDEETNQFYDLRTERNQAKAAVENAGYDRVKPNQPPAQYQQAQAATEAVAPAAQADAANAQQQPRPKGWEKNYGAAKTVAESLGISLRNSSGKMKKTPELVAEIKATDAAAPSAKNEARQPLTPDSAQNTRFGDVVVDGQGQEYAVAGQRHKWLEVAPFVDGRPQISATTTLKFHLEPETAASYEGERRSDPLYTTGRNYFDELKAKEAPVQSENTPEAQAENQTPTEPNPIDFTTISDQIAAAKRRLSSAKDDATRSAIEKEIRELRRRALDEDPIDPSKPKLEEQKRKVIGKDEFDAMAAKHGYQYARGYRSQQQGWGMLTPIDVRKKAEKDAWERGWLAAKREDDSGKVDLVTYGDKNAPKTAPSDAPAESQSPAEPSPLEHTPKQYADAWLRWSAETNGLPLAEVREMQGDEAGLKAIEQRWVDAVLQEAKSGQPLPAKTLDKLLEVRPNAQLPESAIPDGYQRPEARKAEKEEVQARADSRRAAKQGATPADKSLTEIFTDLDSSGLPKAQATDAAKAHPQAGLIEQVNSQFHDLLLDLMEAQGVLEVNGQTTETEDNKSCL